MRLWKIALSTTLFFSLACAGMEDLMAGGASGQADEQEESAEAEEEEEEAEEEEAEEEKEEPVKRERPQMQCTTAALQKVSGSLRINGKPTCLGRWGAADLSSGKRGLFEFSDQWRLVSQGSCTKPPSIQCKKLGFK